MQDIEVTAESGSGKVQITVGVYLSGIIHRVTSERNPDQARALARELLAAADRAEDAESALALHSQHISCDGLGCSCCSVNACECLMGAGDNPDCPLAVQP